MHKLGWLGAIGLIVGLALGCSKPADETAAEQASAGQMSTDRPAAFADEPAASAGSAHHRKHEDRREPVIANAPPLALDVAVKGAPATWHQDSFDKVVRYTKGNDGEARDVWSLRELTHTLVGPTARVISVTGDDGTRALERAAWDDATRTPLLHTTRRGTLKFRWADADGKWGESEVKDVVRVEIAP
jgi:hypothetical protein